MPQIDLDKGIQSFETEATMNGYQPCDSKMQESQLSTTAGYSNTMFSSTTRPNQTSNRDPNQESSQKIEEEFSLELEKESKTLTDAIKRVESINEIASTLKEKGQLCYPVEFEGSMALVFEEADRSSEEKIVPQNIENELVDEEKQLMAKCEEYMNPSDIEILRDNIFWGYYTKYPSFLLAVKNLFLSRIKKAATTPKQRWYFGYLYSVYLSNLLQDKNASKFYADQAKDMELIVNHWKEWKVNCYSYPRIPRCFRQYLEIKTYEPAVNRE